ncbi:Methyltransferase domain-containing protein [Desulfofundulus australicus DSM 11792]|uniref:Methyltransferase domain-containing protein n=1 Tax=Desulfofundulus australicus DSM 11792 TaxID=1121425 RepID=A0A1M4XUX2_9FIRM|nr:class I SAM-dependent methyltransferase [Desulfofundulus australicus]SHE97218.1 Methyltransferase domain-containing protein [Desulfofundulus australicus DSM 11792]
MRRHLPGGSRVLDIGCGDGWLSEALPGYEWYGVEPDPVLRETALAKGMRAEPGSAEKLFFPDGHFDAVCLFDVLEHLPEEDPALQEVRRALKPGGLLFVSVPLYPELWSGHDVRCGHFRRYRMGEVTTLLKKYGFCVLERQFILSLFLPLVFLVRRVFPGGSAGMGLPKWMGEGVCRAAIFDAKLKLPFGLTGVIVAWCVQD